MSEFGKLQLALDLTDLDRAVSIAACTYDSIDIFEVGTPLCLAEGAHAIRRIREVIREKTLIADIRISRAGAKLAEIALNAGADWITAVGEAPHETIVAASEVAKQFNGELQIEPFKKVQKETLNSWLQLGISQLIWHNASEIQNSDKEWSEDNKRYVKELNETGFNVSVTGGITLAKISEFAGLPVSTFIVGRAVSNSDNPAKSATDFKTAISNLYD